MEISEWQCSRSSSSFLSKLSSFVLSRSSLLRGEITPTAAADSLVALGS